MAIAVKNLTLVRIVSYIFEKEDSQSRVDETYNEIWKKYNAEERNGLLRIPYQKYDCWVKLYKESDSCFFMCVVTPGEEEDILSENWEEDLKRHEAIINNVFSVLPQNSVFAIDVIACGGMPTVKDCVQFLQEYIKNKKYDVVLSAGLVYGQTIIARENKNLGSRQRKFIILPVTSSVEVANTFNREIFDDLGLLSIPLGKLERMYHYYIEEGHMKVMGRGQGAEELCERISKNLEKFIVRESEYGAFLSRDALIQLQGYVNELNKYFQEINKLKVALRTDSLNCQKNVSNAEGILLKWDENELEGFARITPSEKHYLDMVMESFEKDAEELEGIQQQLENTVEIIRMHIDIAMQELTNRNNKLIEYFTLILSSFGIAQVSVSIASFYVEFIEGKPLSEVLSHLGIISGSILIPEAITVALIVWYFRKKIT